MISLLRKINKNPKINPNIRYLCYVLIHKWFVFTACCRRGIIWRGIVHDLSKFGLAEWKPYVQHFYGKPEITSMGNECDEPFDLAWLHHIHRNKHHSDYWILTEHGESSPFPMPKKYMLEMLADWDGARLAGADGAQKTTKDWYIKNYRSFVWHPDTRSFVNKELGMDDDLIAKLEGRVIINGSK